MFVGIYEDIGSYWERGEAFQMKIFLGKYLLTVRTLSTRSWGEDSVGKVFAAQG